MSLTLAMWYRCQMSSAREDEERRMEEMLKDMVETDAGGTDLAMKILCQHC